LKEIVLADCPRAPEAHLCLMHGDAEEEAKTLAAEFSEALDIPLESIPIYEMTPAILVHSGPGVLGVSYFVS
jgi:fatty acid-binding protein DegV